MTICEQPHTELPKDQEREWRTYSTPEVRDLAWLFFSPGLIATHKEFSALQLYNDRNAARAWLKSLDSKKEQSLPQRLGFTRLGLYVEALLAFVFQKKSSLDFINYLCLDQHLQVTNEQKTQGEVDFILQHTSGDKIHLEATVKFFLHTLTKQLSPGREKRDWIGPNANDRLDIKFHKMFDHQLPLSSMDTFCRQYPAYAGITHRHHLFSGVLFHHWLAARITPDGLEDGFICGHWLYQSEFLDFIPHHFFQWRSLPKMHWLGGNNSSPPFLRSTNDWQQALAPLNSGRALCFERYSSDITEQFLGRLMVVPDYWPTTKAPARNK